jgi:hypothetical protein
MYNTQKGREIHAKATKGEWAPIVNGNTVKSHGIVSCFPDKTSIFKKICAAISPNTGNAAFIAAAHNDWPAIMDELDAKTAENATLRARLDAAVWDLEGAIDRWALCDLCANSTQDGCLAEKEHGEGACDPKWRGPTAREGEV